MTQKLTMPFSTTFREVLSTGLLTNPGWEDKENLPPRTNTDTSRSSGSASPASTVAMTSQEWDAALILAGFKGTA